MLAQLRGREAALYSGEYDEFRNTSLKDIKHKDTLFKHMIVDINLFKSQLEEFKNNVEVNKLVGLIIT